MPLMGFPLKESNPYPNLVPISWLTKLAHFPVCGCGGSRLRRSIKCRLACESDQHFEDIQFTNLPGHTAVHVKRL